MIFRSENATISALSALRTLFDNLRDAVLAEEPAHRRRRLPDLFRPLQRGPPFTVLGADLRAAVYEERADLPGCSKRMNSLNDFEKEKLDPEKVIFIVY